MYIVDENTFLNKNAFIRKRKKKIYISAFIFNYVSVGPP